jgi:hypothetical protein
MIYEVSTTRISKASKDSIWKILEDMESWSNWGDSTRKTHLISHKLVSREGNVAVCDEDEVAGGFRVQHRDRYTFYPKDKLEEEIIQGPVNGGFVLTLTETPQGTRMDWTFRIQPKTLRFKIVGFFNGKNIAKGIAEEYCKQLSDYAEAHP